VFFGLFGLARQIGFSLFYSELDNEQAKPIGRIALLQARVVKLNRLDRAGRPR
jgi:hypothetical protein